jgi:glycosyltransferase involved in cell wall biosynthesis
MKRVVVLSLTHGRGYGAERVLEYLMIAGKNILPESVIIVAPRESAIARKAEELSYTWLSWESARDSFFQNLSAFFKLARRPEIRGIAIFHGWTSRAFEWVILLSAIKGGVCMGSVHESPIAYFHRFFRKKLIRLGMSRLKRCVYVSKALVGLCGSYSDDYVIIQNGLPDVEPKARTARSPVNIGFLGVNALGKGLEVLAGAIAAMAKEPVKWHLYGEPSGETEALLERIKQEKNGKVVYHGFQPSVKLFDDVDIVFHPSIAFDAYPTVLIESARAGVPVVASRIGGTEEIVVQDVTGLLYDLGEEEKAVALLAGLVGDSTKREKLGRQARDHFESRFRVDAMLEKYLSLWSISHG